MSESILVRKSLNFAKEVVKAYEYLKKEKKESTLSKQLLHSGTSIGANIHEANYAQSKSDFIYKMQIALKECYESEYWIKLLLETHYLTEVSHARLLEKCMEIRRILIATCTTAKINRDK